MTRTGAWMTCAPEELNGRLAVPQIEPNARAHMVQEIGEVEAEIARLLDEQTRRFGGA